MISLKDANKRVFAVALSALLVVSPVLGGCASSKPQQQSSTQSVVEVQTNSPHSVALSAVLSLIDKAGDNIKATFDLTALNGTFADNLSTSDVSLGMDLTNAKVDSFKKGSDPSHATLVVEFPANGRAPEAVKGYGDIALSSKALKQRGSNDDASALPAVVSLASESVLRGDDEVTMPISKKTFDTYRTYFKAIGKSLGANEDVDALDEAAQYISGFLGTGESIISGNYVDAGMKFLSTIGLVSFGGGDAINAKLDKIINMLNVIEAKIDKQTALLQEISAKIDGTQVAAFKKELGELKNYVGYVNAYLGNASDKLAAEGITVNFDGTTQGKALAPKEYAQKLTAKAKEIGDTGTISYDAATNGLVEHFSTVVSMANLNNDQNPLSYYYTYMTEIYNFDTQAYIQTALYMQDIEMTLDNVTALLYTTTDPSNTQMLSTFKDQYNGAIQTLIAHYPAEPDWNAPFSYIIGSKVTLQAGVMLEADKDWVPDMPGDYAANFQARVRDGLANELISACFPSINIDKRNEVPNLGWGVGDNSNLNLLVYAGEAATGDPDPDRDLVAYGDELDAWTQQYWYDFCHYVGVSNWEEDKIVDIINAAATNRFCKGLAWDNYNLSDGTNPSVAATGKDWNGNDFRCTFYRWYYAYKNANYDRYPNGETSTVVNVFPYWAFWFQKA